MTKIEREAKKDQERKERNAKLASELYAKIEKYFQETKDAAVMISTCTKQTIYPEFYHFALIPGAVCIRRGKSLDRFFSGGMLLTGLTYMTHKRRVRK